jgi:hypothetical protein
MVIPYSSKKKKKKKTNWLYLNGLVEVPLVSFGSVFGNPLFSLFCSVTPYFEICFLNE